MWIPLVAMIADYNVEVGIITAVRASIESLPEVSSGDENGSQEVCLYGTSFVCPFLSQLYGG